MKAESNEEYAFILSSLQKRGYTQEEVRSMGREAVFLYPQRLQEVFTGMAETSGLTPDDVLVVYNGGILYLMIQPVQPSCSVPCRMGELHDRWFRGSLAQLGPGRCHAAVQRLGRPCRGPAL